MGKSLWSSVIVKVAVIILLSFDPFIDTVFAPFWAKVLLGAGTYFEDVRSKLRTSDSGILFSPIFFDNIMQVFSFKLFWRASRIETFPVVPNLPTKSIFLNKVSDQPDWLRSIWSRLISRWHFIKAFATDSAIPPLITPPRSGTT